MSEDGEEERVQINVRVSEAQKENWEEYINRNDTGQNTISDLIRTATSDFVNEGLSSDSLDEIDAVATQLGRIERSVDDLTGSMEQVQQTQLTTEDVGDTVDATVRQLLYESIVNNESVEGVSLKDD